jgi:exopolyphosphatase / guanosine-5'-triphosphate,3'-diphosphate pyrophosphatase
MLKPGRLNNAFLSADEMNIMNYAVIDLGSNTFHILIAKHVGNNAFTEIYRERVFVGLSDGGIDVLKQESVEKGFQTLKKFSDKLIEYNVSKVSVIGTAALRSASNRHSFITQAEEITGHPVRIIDGIQEASYIFQGITMIPETTRGMNLIVDIGGGSTEFILINNGEMIKSQSYKLGIGVLASLFHDTEPISNQALVNMHTHISQTLSAFLSDISHYKIDYLIGASGSFELLDGMTGFELLYGSFNEVIMDNFYKIHDTIVTADLDQRLKLKNLPAERARLSPVGLALMKSIISLFKPERIMVSSYAMKEGILRELIETAGQADQRAIN